MILETCLFCNTELKSKTYSAYPAAESGLACAVCFNARVLPQRSVRADKVRSDKESRILDSVLELESVVRLLRVEIGDEFHRGDDTSEKLLDRLECYVVLGRLEFDKIEQGLARQKDND